MSQIGVFTPEQARLLWQDYQERKQLSPQQQHNYPQRRVIDEPSPHRVFIKNTEAEELPAYGCVEVIGTVEVGERTCVEVRKPTKADGEYLFVSQFPVPANGNGWAYRFDVVRMLGTAPTDPARYRPIVNSYEVEEGEGPFVVYGEDTVVEGALIGRISSSPSGGATIEYTISSLATASSGPYTGLKVATVVIRGAPCSRSSLIGTTASVVDHSGCIFDIEDMAGYTGWAAEMVFWSLDAEADCETVTPCHWAAINRCCAAGSGTYDGACP